MEIIKEAQTRINKFKQSRHCDQCHKDMDINDQMTYGDLIKICNCQVYKMNYTRINYPSY